jgi:MoaA/NifB/PqqE/SkfB family radical SAM enzyme
MVSFKKLVKGFIPYGIILVRSILKNNLKRLEPRQLLRFDIHLADHCNLNCIGCEHFSPLSDTKFLDVSAYEKDCIRLHELTSGIVGDISLLGGEPLLHPQIIDFMKITRKYFSIGMIQIITNGILLKQQPDVFWEACKENNIEIYISVYPMDIDYFYIKKLTDKHGIKLTFWGNPLNHTKEWRKLKIDVKGRQNTTISNFMCYASNGCFQLVDSKIFKCWRMAYIHYFNKAFEKNLNVTEHDYFDIYKINDIKELLNKIRKPAPFCRYCDMINSDETEWRQSKKDITEWV